VQDLLATALNVTRAFDSALADNAAAEAAKAKALVESKARVVPGGSRPGEAPKAEAACTTSTTSTTSTTPR